MLNKKKNQISHSQARQTAIQTLPTRKYHQKHSRKPTKDIPAYLYSLLLKPFRTSAQSSSNLQILYNMDTLILNHSNPFTINTKQTLLWSSTLEWFPRYYILSKHQQQQKGKRTIEMQLVNAIRSKEHSSGRQLVIPHYQMHIYQILKRHTVRMKKINKKVQPHNGLDFNRHLKTWAKELPTLISSKDKDQNRIMPQSDRNSSPASNKEHLSQSIQIKALTDCIKNMFMKQSSFRGELGVTKINQNSWLKERKSSEKHFIDCDFSSIQVNSRFDLMIESRIRKTDFTEAEETYGLGELKRRYELQRMSQLKQNNSDSKCFGHRRNPTEALHSKKQYDIDDPLTPKEHPTRSAFGSSKNIAICNEKLSKSKSKDLSPYLLTFHKQKKKNNLKQSNCKQNIKEPRNKGKLQYRSKSKSKQKLVLKSSTSKQDLKR